MHRIISSHQYKTVPLITYILVIVLGFSVYFNSINSPFVWDDNSFIKDNLIIQNPSNVFEIFQNNIGSGSGKYYLYYRPLQELTYLIDYQSWKLDARGYHLTNILLHILTSICIFHLVLLLSSNSHVALISSIIFVVHPVHTEAVSYLSGRGEPLSVLFILMTFIFYLKNLNRFGLVNFLIIFLSSLFAFFTKENSIVLPILIIGYHFCFKRKIAIKGFAPIFLSIIFYIFVRNFFTISPSNLLQQISNGFERIPGFFSAFITYIRLLFFPFQLHFDYGQKLFLWTHWSVILGALVIGFLIIFIFRKREKYPLICFSLFWYMISLIPYSNFYLVYSYLAEHNLYCPSIGFFIICAVWIYNASRFRSSVKISYSLTAFLILYFSSLTIIQNNFWSNPILLYNRVIQYNPESTSSYNNLGVEYARMGEHQKEIDSYQKALEINPTHKLSLLNLGLAYISINDLEKAKYYLKNMTSISPQSYKAHTGLGIAYLNTGDSNSAIKSFEKAIKLKPDYKKAYFHFSVLYKKIGNFEKAKDLLKKGFINENEYDQAYNELLGINSNNIP